jgi:integrase
MRKQYQGGYLRRAKRRKGPDVWEYLWREETADRKRIRHTQVIGTVDQYPTKELASIAVNGLRARVNEDCYRLQLRRVLLADVIDHFLETVLYNESDPYAESTKQITPATINSWILPRWGSTNIRDVRVKTFRDWLRNLRRKDGQPLADSTKAKIRNITRRLFSHAIECEWLEQGKNVIKLVKQSATRKNEPDPFEPEEVKRLLNTLKSPYREMVLVVLSFGLRRSELFALQWQDFDFERNEVSIARTIYGGKVGKCKTKTSRATLPMSRSIAITLLVWRKFTPYKRDDDWLFPSIRAKGVTALDPKDPMDEVIRPAAKLGGINKRVHWHAFRYTFGTWLVAGGRDIAVVHELMRHASPRTTLEFYVKARKTLKIKAQNSIHKMLFPGDADSPSSIENSDVPGDVRQQQKRDALNRIASMIYGSEPSEAPAEPDDTQIDDDRQDHLM